MPNVVLIDFWYSEQENSMYSERTGFFLHYWFQYKQKYEIFVHNYLTAGRPYESYDVGEGGEGHL